MLVSGCPADIRFDIAAQFHDGAHRRPLANGDRWGQQEPIVGTGAIPQFDPPYAWQFHAGEIAIKIGAALASDLGLLAPGIGAAAR